MKKSKWTKKELQLLRLKWGSNTASEMESFLPGRTAASIKKKASELGIVKYPDYAALLNKGLKKCRSKSCGKTLPLSNFHKDKNLPDGLRHICKVCAKKNARQSVIDNPDRRKAYLEKYKSENGEKLRARSRELYHQQYKATRKEYRKKNRESHRVWARTYYKKKYKKDVYFTLSNNLRNRLNRAIKSEYRKGSAVRDLGCSIEELKNYLEGQFKAGMTWDNWGRNGWHIDHIVPLNKFDLKNPKELKKALHYTNLQPLWAEENLTKERGVLRRRK